MIDFELTDEQRLVKETAREFAEREILPYARDNDRAERFDESLPPKLGESASSGRSSPRSTAGVASTTRRTR